MLELKEIKKSCADMSLHSVKQQKCKKERIAEAFSSRRETAAFPVQYVMSPWSWPTEFVGAQYARSRMEYGKEKKEK